MRSSTLTIGTMAAAAALHLACAGPSPTSELRIENAWVRAVAASDQGPTNTAAYMRIVNASESDDRLLEVRSEIARMTELHRTTIDSTGLATMAPAGEIELSAGKTLTFEPGGLHVMLMGVRRTLAVGEKVSLTLLFASAGELTVEAEVRTF